VRNADLTEMEAASAAKAPAHQLRRFLPRGDTLPDAVWKKRHRFLVGLLAAHVLALPIFAMAMGFSVVDSILAGGLLPGTLALAGFLISGPRKVCAGLVSLGLLSCSALLVYFSGGYIEAHFHFFIVIVILGLYEDWLPFALALVFVELHHGIAGAIDPSAVYNHPAAQESPWLWAAVHEVGIAAAAVLSIGTWKLNEELRAQRLRAAHARAVAAADKIRRGIERDLHDGAQQRLVTLGLAVRAAETNVPPERRDLRNELSRVAMGLADAIDDLQELSRGIHPAILAKGGLAVALTTLAGRSAVPVAFDATTEARFPESVEVAAYFVASEALANAAKHSQASRISLSLAVRNGTLELSIRDDGVGGADHGRGSGLVGLRDRVEGQGGSLLVTSPPGGGTRVTAKLPLERERGEID
jgi:signal transduction histidine kinase